MALTTRECHIYVMLLLYFLKAHCRYAKDGCDHVAILQRLTMLDPANRMEPEHEPICPFRPAQCQCCKKVWGVTYKALHTLFKVPHHPLQNTTPPSSKYHTTLFKVPH